MRAVPVAARRPRVGPMPAVRVNQSGSAACTGSSSHPACGSSGRVEDGREGEQAPRRRRRTGAVMPPTEERDPKAHQRRVGGEQSVEMDLAGTLAAAESASPVESLDVVARMLRARLNAAAVSFLIVDFTGSSVVRLGAADSVESDEPPERVALPGTLYADVLRTQRLLPARGQRFGQGRGARHQPRRRHRPARTLSAGSPRRRRDEADRCDRACLGLHRHREPVLHRRLPVGPSYEAPEPGGRDPAPAPPHLTGM